MSGNLAPNVHSFQSLAEEATFTIVHFHYTFYVHSFNIKHSQHCAIAKRTRSCSSFSKRAEISFPKSLSGHRTSSRTSPESSIRDKKPSLISTNWKDKHAKNSYLNSNYSSHLSINNCGEFYVKFWTKHSRICYTRGIKFSRDQSVNPYKNITKPLLHPEQTIFLLLKKS